MIRFKHGQGGVTFSIRVQPRAQCNQIVGQFDGSLKIKIAAPPVEGKANAECQRFLASIFGVKRSDVEILTGELARVKIVRIRGMDERMFLDVVERETRT
jgi:hypothetical protein